MFTTLNFGNWTDYKTFAGELSDNWAFRGQSDTRWELRNAIVGIVLRRAEELASLADELRRSNKELEAFSYSVSHDLRAPFRHIVGFSELLKKQEGDHLSERGRRYVDTIIDSAFTAGTLVDSLLHFSQMSRTALKPRRMEVGPLIEEIRQKLMMEAGDRRIAWRIADLPSLVADPFLIRLVFENLLSNAVKYTRPREVAQIEVGATREGEEVIIFVRDNGVGFDMASSSACTGSRNSREPGSGWPMCAGSSNDMAGAAGRKARSTGGRPSMFPCRT